MATDPQLLEIEGSSLELRFHPLPVSEAIDEFMSMGDAFKKSGALSLLIEAGSGVKFNPVGWDVSDAMLMLNALVTALQGVDGNQKASDIFRGICTRYGVQIFKNEAWEALESIDELGTDLPFVAYACVGSSLTPFFARLNSLAAVKAAALAKSSQNDTSDD